MGRLRDTNRTLVRLGGVFGLLAVVALISGVLVGFASEVNSLAEASSFFEAEVGAFVFFNGVIPLFFIVFFVFFLGVLHGVMRQGEGTSRAEGVEDVLSTAALLGGGVYLLLLRLRRRSSTRRPCFVSGNSSRVPRSY